MTKFSTAKLDRSTNNVLRSVIICIIYAAITACSRYSVSVNNNLVYEPPGLFNDYTVKDPALASCIDATITENNLTAAEQLRRLVCPPGNIRSIEGIESFTAIEYLGLANNHVTDLHPIAVLTQIKQLNVKNNDIRNFTPATSLETLSFLDSHGNIHANCDSLKATRKTLTIKLPSHCSKR